MIPILLNNSDTKVVYIENAEDKEIDIPVYDEEYDYTPLEDFTERTYFSGELVDMLPYPYSVDSFESDDDDKYGEYYEDADEPVYAFYLGGYPHFTQDDFRDKASPHEYTLLLGSESVENMMWGDSGAGGFWVKTAYLENKAYAKSDIYWDCC